MAIKFKAKDVDEVKTADEARELAMNWQSWQSEESMSWGEVAWWNGYFETLAKKFPELEEEYKENAII